MQQRTIFLCMVVLLSTSASAFGRFRVLSPTGRIHDEPETDNDEDDEYFTENKYKDLQDDKKRRGRQRGQESATFQKESSSWFDGMDLEQDYHVPPSSDPNDDYNDHHDDHHHALDSQQTHPLLQIPCAIRIPDKDARSQPVRTFCDTGAQRTVMSWDCAQRTGLLQHLDRRYAGQAMGVGSCRVLGRIPAGIGRLSLNGQVSIPLPAITILESTNGGSGGGDNNSGDDSPDATAGVELLLGLDFLRDYQAILNLRTDELQLIVDDRDDDDSDSNDRNQNQNREVRIPFIRSRTSTRGGAATATSTSTTRRRSSSSSTSDVCDDRDDSCTRVHRHDEWESEEDEEEESDDVGDIDMSGV
jgi:hypothetical protein